MQQFRDSEGKLIPEDKVTALPTKKFFTYMLTKDIQLEDAIMDLLDNCIDGIQRQSERIHQSPSHRYNGFFGDITINDKEFILTDNCGGIPLKIAKEYAFKFGRSEQDHKDDDIETIGMYGIGMKRAIFKMGREAEVVSYTPDDTFKVSIPKKWDSQEGWLFDFSFVNYDSIKAVLPKYGTSVRISNLHPSIKVKFADNEKFITDLCDILKKHYGFIVAQGFSLRVNGIPIAAVEINILSSKITDSESIRPYFFSDIIDNVQVDILIGFYRPPLTESEYDELEKGHYAKRKSENAGITILCNDRIVLYADKSWKTGWGDVPVPQYHTQFIIIAGVVHFRAKNSVQLPVSTTKRDLDESSTIWGPVKNRLKEGLKYFTDFTNNWKTNTEERAQLFKDLTPIAALKINTIKSEIINAKISKRNDTGKYQIPILPKPPKKQNSDFVSINFKKHRDDVATVRDTFLADSSLTPNEVGSWCFDQHLIQATQG